MNEMSNRKFSKIIEVRGEDVPFWVSQLTKKGKKAIGFTGEDLYREYAAKNSKDVIRIIKKIEWKDSKAIFKKPSLCLMGPKEKSIKEMPKELTVCICSKFKGLAQDYLSQFEKKDYNISKIYVNGCVETSCQEGIADVVIDIVYSGDTMKKCGLCVYDIIFSSDCVILGGQDD
ncbi:MAG: hypothetical protein ACXQTP_06120 [Candidatus Methanofastidiosia archaeon]